MPPAFFLPCRDSVDFVQQGALIALALVLAGQPEARAKALEIELAGTSRYANAMRALHAKDAEITAALEYWKGRLHEVRVWL